MTGLLIILAIGFAWSIGAHYTGAVMGMPHALRAIGAWQALLLTGRFSWRWERLPPSRWAPTGSWQTDDVYLDPCASKLG